MLRYELAAKYTEPDIAGDQSLYLVFCISVCSVWDLPVPM